MKKIITDTKIPIKIWTEDIDYETINQLRNIANMPIVYKHIAAMADSHLGKGAAVGSVIPTINAIIPSSVGVDLGCGMDAVKTNLKAKDMPDSLKEIHLGIEERIPMGQEHHKTLNKKREKFLEPLVKGFVELLEKAPKLASDKGVISWREQAGSLGGGNHFIEICLDQDDTVWFMLHSGSRGIGNRIGQYYISKAKELCENWKIQLADKDLSYLPEHTQEFKDYIKAVAWAQEFARINRSIMMDLMVSYIKTIIPHLEIIDKQISCHHNFIALEHHFGKNVYVTRKGAVRARSGDDVIIPGSMGTRSYIGVGRGEPLSFHSCSHGAGRAMSRTAAKNMFSLKDLEDLMEGVTCNLNNNMIDEIPLAYKNIDDVMENQKDLVEVKYQLKQIANWKG